MSEKTPETGEQGPNYAATWVAIQLGTPNPRSRADNIMRKNGLRVALAYDPITDAADVARINRLLRASTKAVQEAFRRVGYEKADMMTTQIPIIKEDGSSNPLNVFTASGFGSEQTTISAPQATVEQTNIQLKAQGSDLRVPDVNMQPKDTWAINFAANDQN